MTNDRAVEILKAIIFMLGRDDYTDEVEEAIHMAIAALTKEAWKEEHPVSPLLQKLATTAQPTLTCDGCRHVGAYDTDFPCSGCIRREKDYYEQER